jgi:hypothetical protein
MALVYTGKESSDVPAARTPRQSDAHILCVGYSVSTFLDFSPNPPPDPTPPCLFLPGFQPCALMTYWSFSKSPAPSYVEQWQYHRRENPVFGGGIEIAKFTESVNRRGWTSSDEEKSYWEFWFYTTKGEQGEMRTAVATLDQEAGAYTSMKTILRILVKNVTFFQIIIM